MNILVTGGAGFIGSHLCKRLVEGGHQVVAIDNLSNGSKGNLKELEENPQFTLYEFDVNNTFKLRSVFGAHPFDMVSILQLTQMLSRAKKTQWKMSKTRFLPQSMSWR